MLSEANDFARARERLLARQSELSMRRERLIADQRRQLDPLTADAPDRAIQQQNDEVVDSLEASVETEAQAIVAALRRLDEGSYGVCETCGAEISSKRLDAVPYTELCQSCAAQANS